MRTSGDRQMRELVLLWQNMLGVACVIFLVVFLASLLRFGVSLCSKLAVVFPGEHGSVSGMSRNRKGIAMVNRGSGRYVRSVRPQGRIKTHGLCVQCFVLLGVIDSFVQSHGSA